MLKPTPAESFSEPFRVSRGVELGFSLKEMRSKRFEREVWGVRQRKGCIDASSSELTSAHSEEFRPDDSLSGLNPDLTDSRLLLIQRCKKFASRMPNGMFFTHTTAALLLGAPLPIEVERDSRLHISAVAESRAPHARGIRGHALDLDADRQLAMTGSLLHTNATRTWFDLANLLRIHDLVAVGDYLIHWRNPRTSVQELRAFCAKQAGRRGVRKARMALPLLSDRSESRPESVLRVILELGGLPHPQINHEIVLTQTGSLVRTDFAFPDQKVLLEYQGDYHRIRKDQWRKDMTRRRMLGADGWKVIELNADDLKHPATLVSQISRSLTHR